MCLIAWNWQPAEPTSLVVIANRDEFYARPSLPMHWWGDTGLLAGQDLRAGGTWLGLNRAGRFAALTNYRDPMGLRVQAPSRGNLVSDFLQSGIPVADYLESLVPLARRYNPFNLLLRDGPLMMGLESRIARPFVVSPGIGAVSNADFNTPWPKLRRLETTFRFAHENNVATTERLFSLLGDTQVAKDEDLPSTGIPLAHERTLSPIFIQTPDYGTRASTVVRISGSENEVWERSFDSTGLCENAYFSW